MSGSFLYEEKYKNTADHTLHAMLYTMIKEEKIRQLTQESKKLLEKIRQTEASGDHDQVINLQKQHQEILATKNDLIHN